MTSPDDVIDEGKFERARVRLGLSESEVATRLGLAESTLNTKLGLPSRGFRERLEAALGLMAGALRMTPLADEERAASALLKRRAEQDRPVRAASRNRKQRARSAPR